MSYFLITVEDKNFKRQLFFEQQAKNLLYALQTNNPDLINPIFDFLNQEKNSETSEVLVSTCDRWIQFIQKEALEVLFMELPLPALLNIYARLNTNHRHISRPSFPRTPHGEQLLKEILIQKLTQYIDSIDKGQRREFYYFKHRQTENRQINYELAKTLREKLATESTAEAFSNIYHLRHQIRLARTNAPWFNFINSRELNDIIALSHQAKFR